MLNDKQAVVGRFSELMVNAITDLFFHDGVVQFNIDDQCR